MIVVDLAACGNGLKHVEDNLWVLLSQILPLRFSFDRVHVFENKVCRCPLQPFRSVVVSTDETVNDIVHSDVFYQMTFTGIF